MMQETIGDHARVRARSVDKGDQREAVPVGQLHDPHGLSVALWIGHAEVPLRPLLDVASLLVADQGDRPAVEAAEAGDERLVVCAPAVAVELDEVLQHPFDVVQRVRPVGMARQLDGAPDLLVARLGDDPVELPLQALELAGQARAAEKRQTAEAVQPLAQLDLGFTRHCRRAAGGGRRSP